MKLWIFSICAFLSCQTLASYDTEFRIFDKTITIPGDCMYLVDRSKFACRSTSSGLVTVSFPSVDLVVRNFSDILSSDFGEFTEEFGSIFAENKTYGQYQHFATVIEARGIFLLRYAICSAEECVSILSGNSKDIEKLLSQLSDESILLPENLNDL